MSETAVLGGMKGKGAGNEPNRANWVGTGGLRQIPQFGGDQ